MDNFMGDFVCTGGASSEEHCGLEVTDTDVTVNGFTFIGAEFSDRSCAAAPGDSGGPVYDYDRGDGRINARGTISFGSEAFPAPCPGLSEVGSSVVVFAPLITTIGDGTLQVYGIDLLTS
jgi:hypothetical protein